jgi:regulator of PEP synthase PpsR (kinase-PPPase family)
MAKALNLFVVSDATGSTAEARRFPFVRTEEQVREIVELAPTGECIIVFTFVSRELAESMIRLGQAKGLTVVDLMSPLIGIFAHILEYAPSRTPGAFRSQSDDFHMVTEAIHYTLRHDDGHGVDTLDQADLIILGISRTGKTPASIFLSCRKLKVANIPIVRNLPLPEVLATLSVPKVGFRMDLERQKQLRSERLGRHSTVIPQYSEPSHIFAEIEYCEKVYKRLPGIRLVDVTNLSIEETSDWITHNVL